MTFAGRCGRQAESEIIAGEDQALQTKHLETEILQNKPRAMVKQRQGFEYTVQHTKTHPLMKK